VRADVLRETYPECMSSSAPPTSAIYRWHDGALELLDYCDMSDTVLLAADSWLVSDGRTLALGLHRERFVEALPAGVSADDFWDAAIAAIPLEGDWFPRVELQSRSGALLLVFRLRSAPALTRSVVVATAPGPDARTSPLVKGPDLSAMLRLRTSVQPLGAL
jgi:hypothetical protein